MSTQSPSRSTARQGASRGQRADRGELAVSTTSPEWEGRPHHRRLPRLTSLLIVLAVLALCVVLAVTQISRRLASRNDVRVTQTVLTADPINFEAAASGSVTEVKVTRGDKVAAGQTLLVVSYINPLGSDKPVVDTEFKAPVAGVISAVSVTTGEAVIGGASLVSMYDPAKMYFEVPMLYKAAEGIKKDMQAVLDVPGIGEVEGTVFVVTDPLNREYYRSNPIPALDNYALSVDGYLELIRQAKGAVAVPIVASLNGTTREAWMRTALDIEQAGAHDPGNAAAEAVLRAVRPAGQAGGTLGDLVPGH